MHKDEALNMARVLMDKRGLWDWQIVATDGEMETREVLAYMVQFDVSPEGYRAVPRERTITIAARCTRFLRMILLNGPVVERTNIIGVREMVLHEIAHALTSGEHDEAWRAMALSIGCTGRPQIDLEFYAESASGKEATA